MTNTKKPGAEPFRAFEFCVSNLFRISIFGFRISIAWLALMAVGSAVHAQPAHFEKDVSAFMAKHCAGGHSGKTPKADIWLDAVRSEADLIKDRKLWLNVLRQIADGAMPPPERPRPSAAEFDAFTAAVRDFRDSLLVISGMTSDPGRPHGDGGNHAPAMGAFLTGVHPRKVEVRLGVSADQIAAEHFAPHTRLPSLNIGSVAARWSCDQFPCIYTSTMSWRSATQPVPKEVSPLVGLRRCHHGAGFKVPMGSAVNSQKYGQATFGGTFADHLQEKLRPREGQADHPILKGLTVADLYPKEHLYRHKATDDLSVILESVTGEPQVWTRTHPTSHQRIVYAIHDGHDLGRSEPVRTLIAQAIFWAAGVNEDAYRKNP